MADQQEELDQALSDAAWAGDDALVVELLAQRANVNRTDECKATPLHNAAYKHPNVCVLLLNVRANVNAVDENKQTPLHMATLGSNAAVCRVLLDNGADVNARDVNGLTPLAFGEIEGKSEALPAVRAAFGIGPQASR